MMTLKIKKAGTPLLQTQLTLGKSIAKTTLVGMITFLGAAKRKLPLRILQITSSLKKIWMTGIQK
jgi:hypothetical protein